MSKEFKVSVRLMTYNHGPFIDFAMQGIMKQKVNFKVEVVVGDDFSDDNTLELIKKYKDTPTISIRILNRKKGDAYSKKRQALGRLYNFIDILHNCHGTYVALLDGDDYWTDPNKLQKQVDFLETHKEYVAVSHNYKNKYYNKFDGDQYEYGELITGRPMTFTLVFRNLIDEFPAQFTQAANGDTFLRAMLSELGKFHCIDTLEPGIRGVHQDGVMSTLNEVKQFERRIRTHKALLSYYTGKEKEKFYREKLARFKIRHKALLMERASLSKKTKLFFGAFNQALKGHSFLYFVKVVLFNKE